MEISQILTFAAKHPEYFGVIVFILLLLISWQIQGIKKSLSEMVTKPECDLHRQLIEEKTKNLILEAKK